MLYVQDNKLKKQMLNLEVFPRVEADLEVDINIKPLHRHRHIHMHELSVSET